MKITDITDNRIRAPQGENTRSFVGRSGRLLMQVHTDEGITGISEAGRNLTVLRAYLEELIKPLTNTLAQVYKNVVRCKNCGNLKSSNTNCICSTEKYEQI